MKKLISESIPFAKNKITQGEEYFVNKRNKIQSASSTNDMIDIMTSGPYDNIPKDQLEKYIDSQRKYYRKEINKKFKGNLEKSRNYFITLLNIDEHNFFSNMYENKNNNMKKLIKEANLEDIPGMSPEYLKNIKGRAEAKYGRTEGMQDIQRVSQMLMQILEIQDGYEDVLTDIGTQLVKNYYEEILDDVDLDLKIVKPNEAQQQKMFKKAFEKPKLKNKKETEAPEEEIHKRKLINNVMQGEGQNVHSMMHEVKDMLDEIDPQLLPLYDEFLKITTRLYWWDNPMLINMISAGMTNMLQVGWGNKEETPDTDELIDQLEKGKSLEDLDIKPYDPEDDNEEEEEESGEDDNWGTGNPFIKVRALIFPLLLHETVKGIYELISSASYLEDKGQEEYIQSKTASIEDELEDIKYGQSIAEDLRNMINSIPGIDKHDNIREFIFGKMVIMPANNFIELMNGVTQNSPDARNKLQQLANEVIKEIESESYVEPSKEVEIKKETNKSQRNYPDYTSMDPKEVEKKLKYLQKGELDFLLNKAIDAQDYANAKIIGSFIKESLDESEEGLNIRMMASRLLQDEEFRKETGWNITEINDFMKSYNDEDIKEFYEEFYGPLDDDLDDDLYETIHFQKRTFKEQIKNPIGIKGYYFRYAKDVDEALHSDRYGLETLPKDEYELLDSNDKWLLLKVKNSNKHTYLVKREQFNNEEKDLDETYDAFMDTEKPTLNYKEYISEIKNIIKDKYGFNEDEIDNILNKYHEHIFDTYHDSSEYYDPSIVVKSMMLRKRMN